MKLSEKWKDLFDSFHADGSKLQPSFDCEECEPKEGWVCLRCTNYQIGFHEGVENDH